MTCREVPVVPAPFLAQIWRDSPRQANLTRLIADCDVEALGHASSVWHVGGLHMRNSLP